MRKISQIFYLKKIFGNVLNIFPPSQVYLDVHPGGGRYLPYDFSECSRIKFTDPPSPPQPPPPPPPSTPPPPPPPVPVL